MTLSLSPPKSPVSNTSARTSETSLRRPTPKPSHHRLSSQNVAQDHRKGLENLVDPASSHMLVSKPFQDCLLQSCCHPRIEGNSTRNSTRATPKKWDMPVSSSELHAGSNQKMVGACFHFRGTSKAQVPLVLSSITFLPGIGASRPRHLPGIEALPSPRQGWHSSQQKKNPVVLWGQLSKVSANLPGRAASLPTWRHAADVSHQLRSSGRFRRPLAPSCAGLAFDRQNRSNRVSNQVRHIAGALLPEKNPGAGLVRAWCGPGGVVVSNTPTPNHEDKETSPNDRNATPRPKPRSRRFAE